MPGASGPPDSQGFLVDVRFRKLFGFTMGNKSTSFEPLILHDNVSRRVTLRGIFIQDLFQVSFKQTTF